MFFLKYLIQFMIMFVNLNALIIRPGTFRYLPSVPASNDIKLLNLEQTKNISTIWLNDIVHDIVQTVNKTTIATEDIHIVTDINKLHSYTKDYQSSNKLFLGWAPKTKNLPEEVLFIIVAEHNTTNNHFNIEHLVQSPYWDSNQIESILLKIALFQIVNIKNYTALNLSKLYENNIRYYMAWELWYMKNN